MTISTPTIYTMHYGQIYVDEERETARVRFCWDKAIDTDSVRLRDAAETFAAAAAHMDRIKAKK